MSNITVPLEPALSSSMAVHLQVIRYMIALYAPKLHKSLDCPESFVQHLKMATKISNDAYSWTKEDRAYYKKVSFRPIQFEKFTKILEKVKKAVSSNPLYSVLLRFCIKIERTIGDLRAQEEVQEIFWTFILSQCSFILRVNKASVDEL